MHVKAVTTELRWSHFPCFSHTLQLAVMQGIELPQVSEVICHCKKVVMHFNHSYVAQRELETKQAQLELPQKKLIQSMLTRWNSSYKMLERLLEQRAAVSAGLLSSSKSSDRAPMLTSDEMECIVKVLKTPGTCYDPAM